MKHILAFTAEPGGGAVLAPVIDLLRTQAQMNVRILARGHGRARLEGLGYTVEPVDGDTALDQVIHTAAADFVLTSATSVPRQEPGEQVVWAACADRGLPCLAMLDQWQNYRLRFSVPGTDDFAPLPTWINCLNRIGQQEMLDVGFPPEPLVCLGHPVLAGVAQFGHTERQQARANLGIDGDRPLILFISEPLKAAYGNARGYTEHEALAAFLRMVERDAPEASVMVRLHPKEPPDKFSGCFNHPEIRFDACAIPIRTLLAAATSVIGMSSVVLIESFLRGTPVVSLQPNINVQDPFVLSRTGLVPLVCSAESILPQGDYARAGNEFPCSFDGAALMQLISNNT